MFYDSDEDSQLRKAVRLDWQLEDRTILFSSLCPQCLGHSRHSVNVYELMTVTFYSKLDLTLKVKAQFQKETDSIEGGKTLRQRMPFKVER